MLKLINNMFQTMSGSSLGKVCIVLCVTYVIARILRRVKKLPIFPFPAELEGMEKYIRIISKVAPLSEVACSLKTKWDDSIERDCYQFKKRVRKSKEWGSFQNMIMWWVLLSGTISSLFTKSYFIFVPLWVLMVWSLNNVWIYMAYPKALRKRGIYYLMPWGIQQFLFLIVIPGICFYFMGTIIQP